MYVEKCAYIKRFIKVLKEREGAKTGRAGPGIGRQCCACGGLRPRPASGLKQQQRRAVPRSMASAFGASCGCVSGLGWRAEVGTSGEM